MTRFAFLVTIWSFSAACTSLSQLQDSVSKFDQGTHTAATAQKAFLRNVQAADCEADFYQHALAWAQDASKNISVGDTCPHSLLPESEYKVRQDLMDAVSLYADKMAALATSDDNKSLDSESQKLAANLNRDAKSIGVSFGGLGSAVESGIIAIANLALDRMRVADLQDAAAAMQPHLTVVVEALKGENNRYAFAAASKLGSTELALLTAIKSSHAPAGHVDADAFFRAVNARDLQRRMYVFTNSSDPATKLKDDPDLTGPYNVALELNRALDAIVRANQAIAEKKTDTGAIIAAVSDLIARAQAAQSMQASLSK